jgi:sialic acid synthase SpsE
LLCPSDYPQPPESFALDLGDFDGHEYEEQWYEPTYIGLSSHCLAPELPIAAVARGCKLVEMHTMLDDEPSELEANVSLSISAFRDMVQAVRRTEEMLA